MTNHRWQFSLRGLFLLTTAAAFVAFLTRIPQLMLLCLLLALPLLLVRATWLVGIYHPRIAATIFACIGLILLTATLSVGVSAYEDSLLDDGLVWVGMSIIVTLSLLCFLASRSAAGLSHRNHQA